MTAAPAPTVFACPDDAAADLAEELRREWPAAVLAGSEPGWLAASGDLADDAAPSLAFAIQCLPNARPAAGSSVAQWAEAVGRDLIERLGDHAGPWRLHAVGGPGVRPGRAKLIAGAVREFLRRKQRRLLRTLAAETDELWADDEAIVQAALATPERGRVSVALPADRRRWRHCLSRFPLGRVAVAEDRRPPSRAYRKLLEAEQHFGRPIAAGETCVDLGASPGGWAWVALQRGARVVAVDRSPLRDDLMRDPGLDFRQGDAFRFEPAAPVDWLLADVIAFPQRTVELAGRWLARGWCRRLVVTMKFRGAADHEQLAALKAVLRAAPVEFLVRKLANNKNEVTAMAGRLD